MARCLLNSGPYASFVLLFILRLVLVVKVIFGQVGTAGHIGLWLAELEVPTPGTLEFQRTGITRFYHADDPYGWMSASVAQILGRKEYLGSTVNFKTVKKSFKHKNSVMNDVDKQVVFLL